jgi:hypothetical protein
MAPTWVLPAGTSGTAGTLANEGGFTTLNNGASHTLQSAVAYPGRGVGVQFASAASTLTSSRLTLPTSNLNYSFRVTITTPSATPSVDSTITAIRQSAGVIFRIVYTATGILGVATSSGGVITLKTAAGLSTQYDVTLLLALDSAAGTTGSYTAKAYTPNTTTQQGSTATLSGSAALGTSAVAAFDVGMTTATSTVAVNVGFGLMGYEAGSTTEIPPYSAGANVAPSVSAGSTQTVQSGTSVTFAFSATDDVSVSSLTGAATGPAAVTLTGTATGTGTTSAAYAPTGTFTTPGVYTVTATASDGTLTGAASTTVYVYPASGTYADPTTVTLGAWTGSLANITDTSVTTYNEGPASPTVGQVQTITLAPHGGGTLTIEAEAYAFSGGLNQTLTLYKADGTTYVDSVTYALNLYDGTTVTAYADATAYAVAKAVTYNGKNYVVTTAVGSGNTTKPDVSSAFAPMNFVWTPTVTSIPAPTDRQALKLTIGDA